MKTPTKTADGKELVYLERNVSQFLDRLMTEREEMLAIFSRIEKGMDGSEIYPVSGADQKLISCFAWMFEHLRNQSVLEWLFSDEGVPAEWEWTPLAYAYTEMMRSEIKYEDINE